MPPKQQAEQSKEHEARDGQQRNAALGENVLSTLGQPADLHTVQVRGFGAIITG